MGCADNIAVVRRFYEAGPPDNDSERYRFAAVNIVWHVPGDNPVSGSYHGHRAVFDDIAAKMQPLDTWRINVIDVMANADLVVATVHLVAARGETQVETDGAHVFRFDANGRIVEVWGFTSDQSALDDVFRKQT
jgi:uncharacterized protein